MFYRFELTDPIRASLSHGQNQVRTRRSEFVVPKMKQFDPLYCIVNRLVQERNASRARSRLRGIKLEQLELLGGAVVDPAMCIIDRIQQRQEERHHDLRCKLRFLRRCMRPAIKRRLTTTELEIADDLSYVIKTFNAIDKKFPEFLWALKMAECVLFFYLGACQRRMSTTCVDLKVSRDASHRNLSDATL